MLTKNELRKEIRRRKRAFSSFDLQAKSQKVMANLSRQKAFKEAETVMIYWPMPDEVSTKDLILEYRHSKRFILPVIQGDILLLKEFRGVENMKREPKFGVEEPVGEEFVDFQRIDLAVVPGMAFDKNHHRLGRGKAYYDKFLRDKNFFKMGICFDFQLLEEVPVDHYDIAMDLVVSETSVW